MRLFAILLALLLTGCKVDAPEVGGYDKVATLLANPFKQCRDINTGRFAKCQTCPDGSRIAVSDECPVPPPPATQTCPDGSVIPADQVCPPPPPPPTQVCPDGSVIPADQVCPVPPPPVPGWEASPSLEGAAPIASEFDPKANLVPIPPAKSASPDVVGAFRFVCDAGQILRDDPLVFPGQPGKSHLHQFYGNTGANANSTYKSLRTSGDSTCSSDPLNRSAYWMPAMLDGKGNVVRPDHVQIYYKRRPKSDPLCQGLANRGEGTCVDIPNGLAFIFGYDMVTGKAPTGSIYYQCVATGVEQLHEPNLAAPTIQACPVGGRIVATIKAPGCWDGKNLKSPNLREHVAYQARDPNYGFMSCPASHPYVIPGFTLTASYSILSGDDPRLWSLSSDAMHPELPAGSTYHADFFMAWDPVTKDTWHANCIDLMLNCSSGDLGNGLQMRNALKADAHLVPIP